MKEIKKSNIEEGKEIERCKINKQDEICINKRIKIRVQG